ncbi:MAG: HEAT repeat domain-containing protein, partial [Candidatus Omnitrophica bacterium]|nr:HEAT repeat domain-containing protein [Candidatus Omnitrophota bacterium]
NPEEVFPVLEHWIGSLAPSDPQYDHLRLEGLWTLQNIRKTDPKLLEDLLESKNPHVRAAAVRVVPQWRKDLSDPVNLLAKRVRDDNPRVRLEAVRALSQFPSAQSADLALNALDFEVDGFLDHALWLTVDELTDQWFPRVQAGEDVFRGNTKKLLYALEVVDQPTIVPPLIGVLSKKDLDDGSRKKALELVAKFGNAENMRSILDRVLDKNTSDSDRANLLAALIDATESRGLIPSGDLSGLSNLFESANDGLRRLAFRAAGRWKIESTRGILSSVALEGDSVATRSAAIDALSELGGAESQKTLVKLINSDTNTQLRIQGVMALANLDLGEASKKAVEILAGLGEGEDPTELFNAFLQRKNGPKKLADSLSESHLPLDVAKLGVRLIGGTGRSEPELIAAISKAGGLSMGRTDIAPAEMTQILASVQAEGSPVRGEALYRSKSLNCITCHSIAGSGGKVGPDLSTIGASAQDDYLVEALLLPNAKVKEGYHSKTVYTQDGEVFTGVPVRETENEMVIRDQFDEEIAIPKNSIESVEEGMSLMPGGLTDLLTSGELADLIAFLSALGEEGPYAISTRPVVRSWEVLMDTPTAKENLRATGMEPVVYNGEFSWSKVYSRVSGDLPLGDLPSFRVYGSYSGSGSTVFVRFQIEALSEGRVDFKFTGSQPVSAWVGTEEIELGDDAAVDLRKGAHTVTLAIPVDEPNAAIHCEIGEPEGSSARARPLL